ncbi:hypothetical protein Moror_9541 [Moniliophthora roreri MCA 2997]|uniref:Uncharacterized protein n=2 Tax=Moniliophthora roreri TaxID=221103 RepID=V2WWD3_MONRO|nr:hypothetical protein Moror_9541 [Moniliophthora roreri MCA 2997]
MSYSSPSFTRFPRRVVVDDTDPRVKYETQSWQLDTAEFFNNMSSLGSVYNNTMHGTSQNSATFSFTFEGEYASVWGAKDNRNIPKNGTNDDLAKLPRWQCQVDELPIESFQYEAFTDWITNLLLCETSGLSLAVPHTLTVNISIEDPQTQMFWFDKIEYTPGPNVELAGETMKFDSSDTSLQYNNGSGSWTTVYFDQTPFANETRTTEAAMSLRFNGTQVSLYAFNEGTNRRAVSSGRYHIDGINDQMFVIPESKPSPFNSSVQSDRYNELLFTSPELSPGTHELVVAYTGVRTGDVQLQALIIDYFYVTASERLANGTGGEGNGSESGSETTPGSRDKPVGGIVGGVIGGVAALTLVGFAVLFLRRRRKQRGEGNDHNPDHLRSTVQASSNDYISSGVTTSAYDPYQDFATSTSETGAVSSSSPVSNMQDMKNAQRDAVAREVVQRRHQDSGIRYADIPPFYTAH